MAIGISALMLLIRMAFLPISNELAYLAFYPGVAITVFLCGIGPGILVIALDALIADFIFHSPYWAFKDLSSTVQSAVPFIISSLGIVFTVAFFQKRTIRRVSLLEHEAANHKGVKDELADTRIRLAGIIDSTLDAIISVNAAQRVIIFNPAAEQLFGYTKAEVLGSGLERLIPCLYQEKHAEHFAFFHAGAVSGNGSASRTELIGVHKTGNEFPMEASVSKSAVAGEVITTIVLRDITKRREVEDALVKSRRQLEIFIREAPISIAMFDRGMNYIAHSRRWPSNHASSHSDLSGRNHYEVYPDIPERWRQIHRDGLAGKPAHNDEDLWVLANGQRCWLRWSVIPWRDENDEIAGLIISTEDITSTKQIESALRLSEEDLNRAQAVGRIGSWRLDVRRNELTWSKENYRIFGLPEGTPQSYESFLACVHPDDRAMVDREWQAAVRDAATNTTPYEITHRLVVAGAVRWVKEKAELELDAAGNLLGGFGITQDITDIKQVREALLESDNRFSSFMSHSPVASWIVDADGRYQYVNPRYYTMFNVAVEDLTGKVIADVFPKDEANSVMRAIGDVIATDHPIELIESCLKSDGTPGDFLKIRFPVHLADDRLLVGGMALDITEQRQGECQIKAANEQLSTITTEQAAHLRELSGELTRAEQRERDRLYELLHDHVQPLLVAMRFELSGLSERTPPEKLLKIVGTVREQITEVIQAARNLGTQLNPPLIMERGLVPALESLRNWMHTTYDLDISLNSAPGIEPTDLSVRLLCFNAIRELLLNVVKHANSDCVDLTLTREDEDMLQVVVADHGVGFVTEEWHDGTGLSNIRRRLEMLGGCLDIESLIDVGTVATLRVPLGPIRRERRLSDLRNLGKIITLSRPPGNGKPEYSENAMGDGSR
ncbi:PAS domain S-box protein [Dechloromonas denitrificans]|uniref:PAS domain S-box protein n=1 Tax=Dechloromonas denitrificans TaxID=281362 RepID=UPI001CFA1AFE|nr:PAS domain S-box protein [Dechloromonas denitrificans]UCV08996.1 PAS domain S-box protein [Dechloromonas denitrificans]